METHPLCKDEMIKVLRIITECVSPSQLWPPQLNPSQWSPWCQTLPWRQQRAGAAAPSAPAASPTPGLRQTPASPGRRRTSSSGSSPGWKYQGHNIIHLMLKASRSLFLAWWSTGQMKYYKYFSVTYCKYISVAMVYWATKCPVMEQCDQMVKDTNDKPKVSSDYPRVKSVRHPESSQLCWVPNSGLDSKGC